MNDAQTSRALPQHASADPTTPAARTDRAAPAESWSLRDLLPALRRSRGLLALWILVTFGYAVFHIFGMQPLYRANALVTLDMREMNLGDVRGLLNGPRASTDSTVARTEMEVLNSDGLARRVITDLDIVDHPDLAWRPSRRERLAAFAGGTLAQIEAVTDLPLTDQDSTAGAGRTMTAEEKLTWAAEAYRKSLSVFNDGRSFAISVGFESSDPDLAARVANRHVALYIEQQRRAKNEDLQFAHVWLEREVNTLSIRLREAERAVQSYREQHRLFTPGGQSTASQLLADVNGQLAIARADLAQREARFRSAQAAARNGRTGEAESEVTNSATIARLRDQEATARRREAELSAARGTRHPDVVAARADVREIQAKIGEQTRQILQSLDSDAAIARNRVQELERSMTRIEQNLTETERAEAGARDLERIASATRTLYETLLARQKQVASQQGIQRPDAVLVSSAQPPIRPSSPNVPVLLVVALIASTGSGLGLTLLRDRLRSSILSVEDVATATGLPTLGVLPRSKGRRPIYRQVVEAPKSAAAEAVRALRSSLVLSVSGRKQGNQMPRIIAITSALPGEGKTSTSIALARSLAASGLSVLLIDADLRNPEVARLIWGRPVAEPGLRAVITEGAPLESVLLNDELTPLRILHAEGAAEGTAPQDMLASDEMRRILGEAAATYDYVIIDTPPAGVVTDAVVLGQRVEAMLLMVRWNRTPAPALAATCNALLRGRAPVTGVVMTDVDPRRMLDHSGGGTYAARGRRKYFEA